MDNRAGGWFINERRGIFLIVFQFHLPKRRMIFGIGQEDMGFYDVFERSSCLFQRHPHMIERDGQLLLKNVRFYSGGLQVRSGLTGKENR